MQLQDILSCPDCGQGPIDASTCTACGHVFADESGTPCLFPTSDAAEFSVRYVPLGEVQAALKGALQMPETAGTAKGDGVYHLDGAHAPQVQNLPKGASVLEVGCGGGQMRAWVEGLGLNYFGTDISKTRVHEHLRLHGGPDFLSDVHHLPVKDNSVDLVYSAAVTEHLAAPHRALQEIFRVLKPGGFYLGNCSFMEPWHDESFFHISPNGAAALLLQAGFEPQAIWPAHKYSGHAALMRMGNRGTQAISGIGAAIGWYSRSVFALKQRLRGKERYSDQAMLADIAETAGATDWIARKPL